MQNSVDEVILSEAILNFSWLPWSPEANVIIWPVRVISLRHK